MTELELELVRAKEHEWITALRGEQCQWLLCSDTGSPRAQLDALHRLAKRMGIQSIEGLEEAIDQLQSSPTAKPARRFPIASVLLLAMVFLLAVGTGWHAGRVTPRLERRDCVCFDIGGAP